MINVLVPDLPDTAEILPWLSAIDDRRRYSNFGPLVGVFESRVRELIPCRARGGAKVLAVSSGTSALELALRLQGLPRGVEVLLPSFNFPAAAQVIRNVGLKPVFADIDPDQWMLTPEITYEALQRRRFSAVIPVSTFGCRLPAEDWDEFVASTGIPVIIDAAAGLGRQEVTERTTVVFSLHATKPFGVGEGGLLASVREEIVAKARSASNFGYSDGEVCGWGLNAKMSEYHAAIGLAQLDRWTRIQFERERLCRAYAERLATVPGVGRQPTHPGQPPAVLQVKLPADVEKVIARLRDADIETRRWYCPALHRHAVFKDVDRVGSGGSSRLTATDDLARHSVGLPFHTRLTIEDVNRVCETLREAIGQHGKCKVSARAKGSPPA
jgi:dTDP-4-amino-4,6-dideoxygalactose transaminase